MVGFEYGKASLRDFRVNKYVDAKGRARVASITLDDRLVQPTDRFWTSTQANFGLSRSIYNYFDHEEVFERVSAKDGGEVRYTLEFPESTEEESNPAPRLLAVSNPTKSVVHHDMIMNILDGADPESITYADGIVTSVHRPRVSRDVVIGPDDFKTRFNLAVPIDGYGSPSIYLGLLRMICENMAVAMSPAFRSAVKVGKDDNVEFSLTRVLDQFGNDEGFSALVSRFEAAQQSWASIHEATSLYDLLVKLHNGRHGFYGEGASLGDGQHPAIVQGLFEKSGDHLTRYNRETIGARFITAWHALTGDVMTVYGLANLDALSSKRQATLPVNCRVYDLINFATEIATHYATPQGATKLQGWIGNLITNEYDMEGTRTKFSDFKDFHMQAKLHAGVTGSN